MATPGAGTHGTLRDATFDDLSALTELERVANLAALGDVFAPERFPFPTDDVLARWALVLEEPGTSVVVRDAAPAGGVSRLDLLAAYDATTLRHLAVHPGLWGRGLGSSAIETALHAMDARGTTIAELWCLEDNHRARRLYEYLGWRASADRRPTPWPPHPTEIRYTRLIPQSER